MNKEKPILYFISGLGADQRAYLFLHFEGYENRSIEWVQHDENDSLSTYAKKLIPQIDTSKKVILIGTSLGGMLATEIAKQIKVEHTFLISSIKNKSEQPFYFKIFRRISIYNLLPNSVLNKPDFFIKILFPAGLKKEWKDLFADMYSKWSPSFLRWAMRSALNWNNTFSIENCTHIHGNRDVVFPHQKIKNFTLIESGTHIMVLSKAKEIKGIILSKLITIP